LNPAFAPLAPQFLGELEVQSPPVLGDLGGVWDGATLKPTYNFAQSPPNLRDLGDVKGYIFINICHSSLKINTF